MSYNKSWEAFKDILLQWVNRLRLKENNITLQDLSCGNIFKQIICEVCKANVNPASNEDSVIKSFLEMEYPEIKLPTNAEKYDLLVGAILIHFWSIRLAEAEHEKRYEVCCLLGQDTDETIARFLMKLLSFNTVQLNMEQLITSIESVMPTTVDVLPATSAAKAPASSRVSLVDFLNSPVPKQQKLLAESQRKVLKLMSALEQEQMEKKLVEEMLATRKKEVGKLEWQLKSAQKDIAELENEVLELQESAQQEIKSLNATIKELELSQQPLKDGNARLEMRCAELDEALQLLKNTSNELSNSIKNKDELLKSLANENKELKEYVKEIQLSELQMEQIRDNELVKLKQELTSCAEKEKLKIEECQSLKSEMEALQLRYTELSTKSEGLSDKLVELKEELTSCAEKVKLRTEECQSLKSEKDALQLRLAEFSIPEMDKLQLRNRAVDRRPRFE